MRPTERFNALTESEHAREHARAAARIQELEVERDALEARLRRVESSIIWQAAQALKRCVGEDSRAARAASAALRAAAGLSRRSAAAASRRRSVAELPGFAEPVVSLILPVHSQPELTAALVRAIATTATVPYELIVVDDTATPAMKQVVTRIKGAMVTVNPRNLGYTASLNRGAALARGDFLVLLNDDTLPDPGWLEAMLECARSSDDVGVVVPMYIDTERRLKEAGSIVWNDGSTENFGRGDEYPERSRYRYRREVDYGSGACLLVRASLFREIGGLDERFSPAYYEDVDLCFAAREAGARVVYEPRAQIVHAEGATAGTDVSAGAKRFQVLNRPRFVEKWAHRLSEQHAPGTDPRRASARGAGPHVLIADEAVPAPDRDGGSTRMWQLVHAFHELGCAVTLIPAGGELREPYASLLEVHGMEVVRSPVEVERELASIGPGLALALLSRPHVASRFVYMLRDLAAPARVAYDVVDLHYLRETRRSVVEQRPAGGRIDALRELELAMVRCTDVTVVVSDEERERLLEMVPSADVEVIPTMQDPVEGVAPLEQRDGIVFVGSFRHSPNVDAAVFLVEHVMPHVWRSRPDAGVTIAGQDPPEELRALAGSRVDVVGWVADIGAVLARTRVAVAPMRYGAGLQLKTVEAMAHGVPVVTTTLGAEGLGAHDGEQLLIADAPEEIAARLSTLFDDDGLWRRLSDAGRAHVHECFGRDAVVPRLEALLAAQQSRKA